jgi:hypothetical protein
MALYLPGHDFRSGSGTLAMYALKSLSMLCPIPVQGIFYLFMNTDFPFL